MTKDTDMQLVVRALHYAAQQHSTQRRKDAAASPYINHPVGLLYVLAVEAGITNTVVLAAAALHDTIEDTTTTADDLRRLFGNQITEIVLEVTDDKRLDKNERKRLQVAHAHKKSAEAAMVKFADKICNLRDMASSPPASWSIERRRDYFDWAKSVVDGLPNGTGRQTLQSIFDAAYAMKP